MKVWSPAGHMTGIRGRDCVAPVLRDRPGRVCRRRTQDSQVVRRAPVSMLTMIAGSLTHDEEIRRWSILATTRLIPDGQVHRSPCQRLGTLKLVCN